MRISTLTRWVVALALLSFGYTLQASNITIGGAPLAGTGNCDPFGCPEFFGLGTYQQVYSASAFSAGTTIEGLTFYGDEVQNGAAPAGGNYTLSFSYTSNAPNDLDIASPTANVTSGSQVFFSGTLPGMTANTLNFAGTPFVYDPANGNLLLTVKVTNPFDPVPMLYLDEASTITQTTNAYFGFFNGQPISGGNNTGGLITGFNVVVNGVATPEPASFLLVLAGAGMIAFTRRRRRLL